MLTTFYTADQTGNNERLLLQEVAKLPANSIKFNMQQKASMVFLSVIGGVLNVDVFGEPVERIKQI